MTLTRAFAVLALALAGLSTPTAGLPATPGQSSMTMPMPDAHAPKVFSLKTGVAEGRLVYIGVGGDIEGKVNPELDVHEGELVQINLINGEGAVHDVFVDNYGVHSMQISGKGAGSSLSFVASKTGQFAYFCTLPGHRDAGMQGVVKVIPGARSTAPTTAADISRDPADVPPPIGLRGAQTVRIDLTTREVQGQLADKTTYTYWTFNGKVPGPLLRARVGDLVEVHLSNDASSVMFHSVDFHAATGPGGGAEFTQTEPGKESIVTFKALVPGLFVYHCATPSVPQHITNGMYGLILIEPEGGLPRVDREFYVMQGELYTTKPFGIAGDLELDFDKLAGEHPEYFLFNGAVGALTTAHPLRAQVGETVRIYFGVGGPNFTSSFHVIGEIFDHVYSGASLGSPPLTGVQTVSVPPGGATVVDFKIARAGRYTIVDHALSRLEKGLVGSLIVDGPKEDALMHAGPASAIPASPN